MSLMDSATRLVTMLVSAQGWDTSLAALSPLMPRNVATLLLNPLTDPSMDWLVSDMNCSHTAFSLLSTSFLESRRFSWTPGVELRMNSSKALLLLRDRMDDLT